MAMPSSAPPPLAPEPTPVAAADPVAAPTRRFTDAVPPCATRLGHLQIRGTITGTDSVELAGTFEGPVTLDGMFHVLEGGRVTGTISATDVVIAGEVDGHVTARGRLEMRAHARVLADVVATTVAIAEGCFIEGRIHMRGATDTEQPTAFKEKRKGKRKGGHKAEPGTAAAAKQGAVAAVAVESPLIEDVAVMAASVGEAPATSGLSEAPVIVKDAAPAAIETVPAAVEEIPATSPSAPDVSEASPTPGEVPKPDESGG